MPLGADDHFATAGQPMNRRLIVRTPEIRARAAAAVAGLDIADPPWEVEIRPYEEPQSDEQRSKMWAMLGDLSAQVQWPVNGRMQRLTKEDWKDLMTSGLEQNQRIAQGIEGGFVVLGARTSKMGKKRMTALIELIQFFGDARQVVWTDPKRAYEYDNARQS